MILPNTVTSLTAQTYKACTNIESFVFPNTVTNLNVSSYFQWCGELRTVTLPANATGTLGSSFFYTCTHLDNVIIPGEISGKNIGITRAGLISLKDKNSITAKAINGKKPKVMKSSKHSRYTNLSNLLSRFNAFINPPLII